MPSPHGLMRMVRPNFPLPLVPLETAAARLMRGIIEVHLNDYLRPPQNRAMSRNGRHRRNAAIRLHDEARIWFFEDTPRLRGYVFSFVEICHYLGWSPEFIRRGIRLAHDRMEQGQPISVIIERADI